MEVSAPWQYAVSPAGLAPERLEIHTHSRTGAREPGDALGTADPLGHFLALMLI